MGGWTPAIPHGGRGVAFQFPVSEDLGWAARDGLVRPASLTV